MKDAMDSAQKSYGASATLMSQNVEQDFIWMT
jgi:hypothetical protein